jgi:hypothetical protein
MLVMILKSICQIEFQRLKDNLPTFFSNLFLGETDMIPTIRKARRTLWNFQRILGTLTMILELLTGQWKRGGKKLANKFIGRHVVRRIFFK